MPHARARAGSYMASTRCVEWRERWSYCYSARCAPHHVHGRALERRRSNRAAVCPLAPQGPAQTVSPLRLSVCCSSQFDSVKKSYTKKIKNNFTPRTAASLAARWPGLSRPSSRLSEAATCTSSTPRACAGRNARNLGRNPAYSINRYSAAAPPPIIAITGLSRVQRKSRVGTAPRTECRTRSSGEIRI